MQNLDDIYKSFMRDIYYYLLSLCHNAHIAEDIMQETFFRAYLHFESCPTDAVKPWLFRVAHNAYVDFKRKDSRSHAVGNEFFNNMSYKEASEIMG